MNTRPYLTLLKFEVKTIAEDPTTLGLLFGAPLMMILVLHNVFRGEGLALGVHAYSLTFAAMISTWVLFSFFKEFGWSTWPRIRATGLSVTAIVICKLIPYVGLGLLQQLLVCALGFLVVGEPLRSLATPLMAVTALGFSIYSVALGFMIVAIFRNHMQAATVSNLLAFAVAAIGGGLAPQEILPAWAQAVSWLSPVRWALEAYTEAQHGDATAVFAWTAPLVVVGIAFLSAGVLKFRESSEKQFAY